MCTLSKVNNISSIVFLILAATACNTDTAHDPSKIYDQKYVDSTLYMLVDSLEQKEYDKYEQLLNDEAQRVADSIMNIKVEKSNTDLYELRTPKPHTKDLPEPNGPDYSFPEE